MKKIRTQDQGKNIIAARLAQLRNQCGYSQRELADKLQLADFNVDKNLITRIETNSRYVSDFELKHFLNFSVYPIPIFLMGFQRMRIWRNILIYLGKEGKKHIVC